MIEILIILLFNGFSMTIDAKEMWGIESLEQCSSQIQSIKIRMGALDAQCGLGDILEEHKPS